MPPPVKAMAVMPPFTSSYVIPALIALKFHHRCDGNGDGMETAGKSSTLSVFMKLTQ
jgi:hypothetical protein